jgi:ubiquitin-protein ligase
MFKFKQREYTTKLEECRNNIVSYSGSLAEEIRREKELMRMVVATDMNEEKDKFIRELNSIRNAKRFVKDVEFSDTGVLIHLKHVYVKLRGSDDQVLHCGELDLNIPFELRYQITVTRRDNPKDPRNYRGLYPHPNVFQEGRICLGDIDQEIPKLRAEYEMSAIFIMINGFLHTYNPESPTNPPENYPTSTIAEAEQFVSDLYKDAEETICGHVIDKEEGEE